MVFISFGLKLFVRIRIWFLEVLIFFVIERRCFPLKMTAPLAFKFGSVN